jgi:hypothetical protein
LAEIVVAYCPAEQSLGSLANAVAVPELPLKFPVNVVALIDPGIIIEEGRERTTDPVEAEAET